MQYKVDYKKLKQLIAQRYFIILIIVLISFGCSFDYEPQLPPVEVREAEAIENLRSLLTSSANGWKLDYRPNSNTGSFFILMDFYDDDFVRIQSDITVNNGQFRDDTVTYRIDSSQGIELILETYGVFHYLFDLDQATFGGEFEFIFEEEEDDNLIFRSKTDFQITTDITILTFQLADVSDELLISTEALPFLSQGIFQEDNLAGIGSFGTFNFYVPSNNHTISTIFDLNSRSLTFLGAAVGQNQEEIGTVNTGVLSNASSLFSLQNERIVLDQSQSITLEGISYTIDELEFVDTASAIINYCIDQEYTVLTANGDEGGLGSYEATSSLFQVRNNFTDDDAFYSINHIFIFNENDSSYAEQIEEEFPNAAAFQWYFGTELSDGTILNAVGFVTVDEFNNAEFFLRGFDYVQNGNFIEITFNGDDFITDDDATPEQLAGLDQLTDVIFNGGQVYVLELPTIEGLFEFYNPCNRYKGFLL